MKDNPTENTMLGSVNYEDSTAEFSTGRVAFFQMMTPNVRYLAVILSVTAGVIASQALITGMYSWPRVRAG